jgi:hypothetical protein
LQVTNALCMNIFTLKLRTGIFNDIGPLQLEENKI